MICPACGTSEWHARRVLEQLTVRTCSQCGFLAGESGSAPAISYEQVDDAAYEAALGELRRAQAAEILRFVRAYATGGTWLDIGCGPGYLLEEAAAVGFRVRGIEPDAKAASLARTRLGEDAVRHDLFREQETEAVDVLSTLDVLEHIPVAELPDFAERIHRSLRPDGVWVIKAPSAEGLFFRIAHTLGLRAQIERLWQVGHVSPHTVYFTHATLTAFLRRHGFDVVAHRYFAEVPLRNAVARLTMLGTMPRWQAVLVLPVIAAINAIERVRGKSDALAVIARPARTPAFGGVHSLA